MKTTSTGLAGLLALCLLATPLSAASLVAPTPPTGLAAAPSAPGAIALSWNASASLVGVASYRVYHVESDGNLTFVGEVAGDTLAYEETGLAPGVTMTYEVTAVDLAGESEPSSPASATTWTVASAPQSLEVAAGPGALGETTLTWQAPLSDGGAAITGYVVYRDGALVATLDAAATSYQDAGLTPLHAYAYEVAALNAVGEGEHARACGLASPWSGALGCQGVL